MTSKKRQQKILKRKKKPNFVQIRQRETATPVQEKFAAGENRMDTNSIEITALWSDKHAERTTLQCSNKNLFVSERFVLRNKYKPYSFILAKWKLPRDPLYVPPDE